MGGKIAEINTTIKSKKIEDLLDLYGNEIIRMCYLYLKDYQLAEDALQDTYFKLYMHLDDFRNESNIKTYITRIAINTCKDYLKKQKNIVLDSQTI